MKSFIATLLAVAVVLLVLVVPPAHAAGSELKSERLRYIEALRLLKAGKDARFKVVAATERGYLLFPYLQYHYLRARLAVVPERRIRVFLQQQAGQPIASQLRRRYLTLLASQHRWPTFLAVYRTADATTGLR